MARPNKIIVLLLKIVVSGGFLYAVVSRTGIENIVSSLKDISRISFLIAVTIYFSSILISALRWKLLLHERFDFRRLLSFYMIGSFFNQILPGIIGGDAVKAYYLYKDTGRGGSAVASVFMDRYIGFTALMFVGLTAFPFGLRYFRGTFIEWILPLMILLFIVGSFVVFGLKIGKGIRFLSGFYSYFEQYKGKGRTIVQTFFISLVIQVVIIFAIYVLAMGLHLDVPLLPFFMFIPIISTISTVPVSIAGIGVREASFVLLFGSLGISPVHATAMSFAWFLSMAAGSLPGLVEYIRYKKTLEG